MDILLLLFAIIGNMTSLFLFLSPIITFKKIIKKRSTEQFSCFPYVMTFLGCLLSAWYGLPFVSRNNIPFSTVTGVGAAIEVIYILIFLKFAPKNERNKILFLVVFSMMFVVTVVLVSLFALHDKGREIFCGVASSISAVVTYASPLSTMRLVIRTRSVQYMPLSLSLFVFLCGSSWFLYGLLENDCFVYVRNGLGCALGAAQLLLYFSYRGKKGGPSQAAGEASETVVELSQMIEEPSETVAVPSQTHVMPSEPPHRVFTWRMTFNMEE